jgi:hypothetical protein
MTPGEYQTMLAVERQKAADARHAARQGDQSGRGRVMTTQSLQNPMATPKCARCGTEAEVSTVRINGDRVCLPCDGTAGLMKVVEDDT